MSTAITSYVSLTCDTPLCNNTVTFLQTPEGEQEARNNNPWMNSLRFVQTPDGRKFLYCSDECEAKAVGFGQHNQKVIVTPAGPNAVEQAAKAAANAKQATEQLKAGSVTLD